MPRTRTGVIDQILTYEEFYIDGEVPPPQEDFFELGVSIHSVAVPYTSITVWGRGLVTFGPPTAAQTDFMANLGTSTDLSLFPGDYVAFGFSQDAIDRIPVLKNDGWVGGMSVGADRSDIFISDEGIQLPGGFVAPLGHQFGWRIGDMSSSSGSGSLFLYWSDLDVDVGSDFSQNMNGTANAETLMGLGGNDTLNGFDSSDKLEGGSGNDHLIGGSGHDRLFGDDGDDLLDPGVEFIDRTQFFDFAPATEQREAEFLDGGDGFDIVRLNYASSPTPVGQNGQEFVAGPNVWNVEAVEIIGSQFADTIVGTASNDRLFGGAGFDRLDGGAGNDRLDAGPAGPAAVSEAPDGFRGQVGDVLLDPFFVDTPQGPTALVSLTGSPLFYDSHGYTSYGGAETFVFTGAAGVTLEVRFDLTGDISMSSIDFGVMSTGGTVVERQFHEDPDPALSYNYFVLPSAGTYFFTGIANPGVWVGAAAEVRLTLATAVPYTGNLLIGGDGDDIYGVYAETDRVIEAAGGGVDQVNSSISYTLSANVEKLVLTGSAATNGNGNASDNFLYGNAAVNILNGRAGADWMRGGAGDDLYYVDNAGDEAIESATGGYDQVNSAISHQLDHNIEKLVLTGTAAIDADGNASANLIYGNSAVNVIDGRGGADVMRGGAGDDVYYVDNAGDRVSETATGGYDRVYSWVSHTLGNHVERLALIGSTTSNGKGNALDNVIYGNSVANILWGVEGIDSIAGGAGNDRIYGGAGDDRLRGDAGADRFYFDSPLNPATNVDRLLDFSVADDTIVLDQTIFSALALGTLSAAALHIGSAAHDSDDRIIYNSVTGRLYYDADGNGAGAQVHFADIGEGQSLTNADVLIVG